MSASQEASDSSTTTNSPPDVHPQRPARPPPPRALRQVSSLQQHLESLQCLRQERVRWFVKEDKKWTPFNGSDSLAIEKCYRRIQELESRKEDASKPLNTSTIYELPTVKGGLYEVDVVPRECIPIYWEDKALPVCRGTWFYGSSPETWQPMSEEDAEQIEASHQAIWRALGFSGSQKTEGGTATNKHTLGHLQLKGYHVEWNDESDVSLYWDDVKSRIMRGVIGISSASTSLHRGYHTDASPEDKPPEISHLVFVVHGIGQLLHLSNIVKSCSDLRRSTARILEKHSSRFSPDQRLEFFPIEWRSSLKLDDGTIKSITPSTVPGLRKALNTSMMDIMYYTSPFYRYEIIDGVRDELNHMYDTFCKRNPSFVENNGKVSIVSHSLGSVIAYDILSLWDLEERHLADDATAATGFLTESFTYLRSFSGSDQSAHGSPPSKRTKPKENLRVELAKARSRVMELEAQLESAMEHGKEAGSSANENRLALKFKVESLYCLGSPLAVFLALRGLRPQDDVEDHVLPKSVCKRVVNIYHPADPIAYRLEPLISEDYSCIPPVQMHRFDSQKSGYNEEKKDASPGGAWKMLTSAYTKMGYRKSKGSEETNDDDGATGGDDEDEADEDDAVVIVDHNVNAAGVGAEMSGVPSSSAAASARSTGGQTSTDGASGRSSWISWFGRASRADSSSAANHKGGGDTVDSHPEKDDGKEHIQVPDKALSQRLDFVLREGYMESNYWSAVTSHISYWGSCDVARFIVDDSLETAEDTDQS